MSHHPPCITALSFLFSLTFLHSLTAFPTLFSPHASLYERPHFLPLATDTTRVLDYHVTATVIDHFMETEVLTEMYNDADTAQLTVFSFQVPDEAFISSFAMQVGSLRFKGAVKEKTEAQQEFQNAVDQGQSAGLVSTRGNNLFQMSVSLPPRMRITFTLDYQQVLVRNLGVFTFSININPPAPTSNGFVSVNVKESSGVQQLSLTSEPLPQALVQKTSQTTAKFAWFPAELPTRATLMFQYSTLPLPQNGIMIFSGDYFVHLFAPTTKVIPKAVVFIIDKSGSMDGTKMNQAKQAFAATVLTLRSSDYFEVTVFSSGISSLFGSLKLATSSNIEAARVWIDTQVAEGGTNIHGSILSGINQLGNFNAPVVVSRMLIFLTDGQASTGVTSTSTILTDVQQTIQKLEKRVSLFTLGFGDSLNLDLITRLALENNGLAQRIYEDGDAVQQMQKFLESLSSPLLLDVQMNYRSQNVALSATRHRFPTLFQGAEIMVVGRGVGSRADLVFSATADGAEGADDFSHTFAINTNPLIPVERLWAVATVNDLLQQKIVSNTAEISAQILELSLNYSLVTPLTSLIVVEDQSPTPAPTTQSTTTTPSPTTNTTTPSPTTITTTTPSPTTNTTEDATTNTSTTPSSNTPSPQSSPPSPNATAATTANTTTDTGNTTTRTPPPSPTPTAPPPASPSPPGTPPPTTIAFGVENIFPGGPQASGPHSADSAPQGRAAYASSAPPRVRAPAAVLLALGAIAVFCFCS